MVKQKTILFLLLICITSSVRVLAASSREFQPEIVIWAWERHENLLFLKDGNVRVAFYAGIITFADSKTVFIPRRQPLIVSPEVPLTAVLRIENKQDFPPDQQQLADATQIIAQACENQRISGCQIDFDCKSSETRFLENLITGLKRKFPSSMSLSITALASWSHSGSWIESLPVDEAVPMLFRMGADNSLVRNSLAGKSFMRAAVCRKSVGISLDEPFPPSEYLKNRRIYIFNSCPWTQEDFSDVLIKIRQYINEGKVP